MTRWVKQQYESVFAFIFIVLAAIIPWNFSVATAATPIGDIRIINIRWWIGEIHHVGIEELNEIQLVTSSIAMQEGNDAIHAAYQAWGVTSILVAATLLLAAALLVREEQIVDAIPIHLVAGGMLFTTGVVYCLITVWISMVSFPGLYVPVGGVLTTVFGILLLTNRIETRADLRNAFSRADPE